MVAWCKGIPGPRFTPNFMGETSVQKAGKGLGRISSDPGDHRRKVRVRQRPGRGQGNRPRQDYSRRPCPQLRPATIPQRCKKVPDEPSVPLRRPHYRFREDAPVSFEERPDPTDESQRYGDRLFTWGDERGRLVGLSQRWPKLVSVYY